MNYQNDKLFHASLIALVAIYAIFSNAASLFNPYALSQLDIGFARYKNAAEPAHYTLQFHKIDGERLATPLYFDVLADEIGLEDAVAGERLINRMGIAYYAEDFELGDMLLNEFEQSYLGGMDSAEFDLVLLVFNPVERYSLNSNVAEQKLASFQYAGAISQVYQ